MKRRDFIGRAAGAGAAAALGVLPAGTPMRAAAAASQAPPAPGPKGTARIAVLNATVTSPSEACNPAINDGFRQALRSDFYEERVRYHEALFEEAGRRGFDLVCASEDMTRVAGARAVFDEHADQVTEPLLESVPGPLSDRLGAIARRHRMYIAAPYFIRENGEIYNAVVLIDREGAVQGIYRKTHPVREELAYITPGDEFPVFDTDFGRIAFMICWDMMYPEVPLIYALQGVDMILWPTAAIGWDADIGLATLRVRASDHSVYFGASAYNRPASAHSCIVDHDGEILIDVGHQEDAFAWAEIDFSKPRERNIKERVLRDRRPQVYGLIDDPNPPITKR